MLVRCTNLKASMNLEMTNYNTISIVHPKAHFSINENSCQLEIRYLKVIAQLDSIDTMREAHLLKAMKYFSKMM